MIVEVVGTQKEEREEDLRRVWRRCWVNFTGYSSAKGSSNTSLSVAGFAAILSSQVNSKPGITGVTYVAFKGTIREG